MRVTVCGRTGCSAQEVNASTPVHSLRPVVVMNSAICGGGRDYAGAMGLLGRLFGGPPKSHARPEPPRPATATTTISSGIQMHPEPWTLRSLPTGLAQSDFQDAAVALSSQQITGQVIPVPAVS
jgi:hypothetical protein